MKKIKTKNCLKCGKEFQVRSLVAKWCSKECGRKIFPLKEKNCLFCKNSFTTRTSKKYCSGKCVANQRSDHLKKIHNAKRKYPKIEGLNRCQIFRKFNPDKNREELHRDNLKRGILILALGGKCCFCGYDKDLRALNLDHINGDGKEDRKKFGSKISRYYINNLDQAKQKLQVLCCNCHSIKTYEKNEHTAIEFRKKK